MPLSHGLRANGAQVAQLLLQVLLVGLTLGMMRTVVPALAEAEYGVPRDSFMLLAAFVVAFGVVKAVLNFVAGRWSERVGRRRVLLAGWLVALPIPVVVWLAPSWNWIVFATVLLGVNQGLCWSMTQTAKLDLTRPQESGLTLGLNEFAGYGGVAIAGVVTAWLAEGLGPRTGLLVFGVVVIGVAIAALLGGVRETLPWAHAEITGNERPDMAAQRPRYPDGLPARPTARQVFALVTWRDRRLAALCQAGLVEKFVDALIWIFYPVYLHQHGLGLPEVGAVIGVYGLVWGVVQLGTGRLSDRYGRQWPNVWGMWLCGAGVALMLAGDGSQWWSFSAAVTGLGMALLYPNLSAAVADISHPAWRGTAIGIYRFWRDLGYAIGAMALGFAAHASGRMEAAFLLVAASMVVSGVVLLVWGEETHPRLNPAPQT